MNEWKPIVKYKCRPTYSGGYTKFGRIIHLTWITCCIFPPLFSFISEKCGPCYLLLDMVKVSSQSHLHSSPCDTLTFHYVLQDLASVQVICHIQQITYNYCKSIEVPCITGQQQPAIEPLGKATVGPSSEIAALPSESILR